MKVIVEATVTPTIWRYNGAVKLRIYANQSFFNSDGQYVPAGTPGRTDTAYLEITCTVLSGQLTIPSFEIDSTVDGLDSVWTTYTAELTAGNRRITFLPNFAVNTLQDGDPSTTWAEIINLRNMLEPQSIPESLSRQLTGMIQTAVGDLNKASSTNTGVTALTVDPIDPTFPRAVAANDPQWLEVVDSLDASPDNGGIDVAGFAASGDGSEGAPWDGWYTTIRDNQLGWTSQQAYRFRSGVFAHADTLEWGGINHTRFVGNQQGATKLKYTGNAPKAISFTSPGGQHTQGIVFENFLVFGAGATTTYGLYCEAVHRSIFRNIRLDNIDSFGVFWKFGILNLIEHIGLSASWQGGLTLNPAWVFATDLRNPGETFQENTVLNILAEGGTAGGILLQGAWQNKLTGTAESNPGKGVLIDAQSEGNVLSLNVEDNGDTDFEIFGHRNILLGCISASVGAPGTLLIKANARGNRVIGGRYNNITVEAAAVENYLAPSEMRGVYSNMGTLTHAQGPWWTGVGWQPVIDIIGNLVITGEFTTSEGRTGRIRQVFGDGVIQSTDDTLLVDAVGVIATLNIANAASAIAGHYFTIKNNHASSHNVIIDPAGGDTIDGGATYTLTPGQCVTIQSDGANWRALSKF